MTDRWPREPCPAELPLGGMDHPLHMIPLGVLTLTCQAQQIWNGPHKLHHDHVWAGWVGDQWVRVNWRHKRGGS